MRSPIGGLAANLSADYDTAETPPACAVQINGKLWLQLPAKRTLHWRDATWLMYGADLHSSALNKQYPHGLTIRVRELSFPLSDYVSEVAAFAMTGWIEATFDLPSAPIAVEYDPGRHRYTFSLDAEAPSSDEHSEIPTRHVRATASSEDSTSQER